MLFPLHGALGHADGTSGADDAAEVATYAFSAYQTRTAGFGIEGIGHHLVVGADSEEARKKGFSHLIPQNVMSRAG